MNSIKWHKGPPPHVGWWNASTDCNPVIWRWWNGEWWSLPFTDIASIDQLKDAEFLPERHQDRVKWSDYYPENARVERKAP